MREWDYEQLAREIDERKAEVERRLLADRPSGGRLRTRPRDPEEQALLDRICLEKWREAERSGKVVIFSRNEWYYEP